MKHTFKVGRCSRGRLKRPYWMDRFVTDIGVSVSPSGGTFLRKLMLAPIVRPDAWGIWTAHRIVETVCRGDMSFTKRFYVSTRYPLLADDRRSAGRKNIPLGVCVKGVSNQ